MGKYKEVMKALKKLNPSDTAEGSYRDLILQKKQEILGNYPSGLTAADAARAIIALRRKKAEWESGLKQINAMLEAASELGAEAFEQEDVTSIKLEDGSSVRHQPEPFTQVKNPDALREWAIQNDLQRLFSIPWQTVNTMMKDRLLAGELIPDFVEVFVKNAKFVVTGVKQ